MASVNPRTPHFACHSELRAVHCQHEGCFEFTNRDSDYLPILPHSHCQELCNASVDANEHTWLASYDKLACVKKGYKTIGTVDFRATLHEI
jgi:hypothetical protein